MKRTYEIVTFRLGEKEEILFRAKDQMPERLIRVAKKLAAKSGRAVHIKEGYGGKKYFLLVEPEGKVVYLPSACY